MELCTQPLRARFSCADLFARARPAFFLSVAGLVAELVDVELCGCFLLGPALAFFLSVAGLVADVVDLELCGRFFLGLGFGLGRIIFTEAVLATGASDLSACSGGFVDGAADVFFLFRWPGLRSRQYHPLNPLVYGAADET